MPIDYTKYLTFYLIENYKNGVDSNMPSIDAGRLKVLEFIKQHDLSINDLAVAYGIKKQDMHNYLNGNLKTPKANQLIIRIISDYKIR